MQAVKRFEETLRASQERHYSLSGEPISYETIKRRKRNKKSRVVEASIRFDRRETVREDVLNNLSNQVKIKSNRLKKIILCTIIFGTIVTIIIALRAFIVSLEASINKSDADIIVQNDMIAALDEKIKDKEDIDFLKKIAIGKKLKKYKKKIKMS